MRLDRRLVAAFAFLAAVLAAPAAAQSEAAAGRFLMVTGPVSVLSSGGAERSAERGSELREGDTVRTGDNALAQMRMSDGSLLSLRSGSEFKLERFQYAGANDSSAAFVMNVIKGGFRTITGMIARANRPGYRITTPVATIGVRGTHFEVVHVQPQLASTEAPAGTYNHVYEGITTMQNPSGMQLVVNREQTAFTALQAGARPVLVAPPAVLFGRPTPVPRAAVPPAQQTTRATASGTPLRTLEPVTAPVLAPTTTLTPLEPTTTTLRTLDTTTTKLSPTITTTTTTTTTLTAPTTTTTTTTSPTTTLESTTTTLKQPIKNVTSPVLTR